MDAREQGAGIVLLSERKDRVTAADAGLVLMPAAGKRLFPLRRKNSEAFHIILFASRAPDQFHDQPRQEK